MKKITILLLFFYSVASAQLELPYSVKNVTPRPLDFYYYNSSGAPYASLSAANSSIPTGVRYRGMTVNINGLEYWYGEGITNSDLKLKFQTTAGLTNDLSIFAGKTLLAVGNSVTFGVGASSPPFRWTSQLAARLQMNEQNIGQSFMDVLFPVSGNAPPVVSATNPSTNVGQITFSSNHVIASGAYLTLTGFTPSTWNGTYFVSSVSPTSVSFNILTNPGNATVVGTATFQNGTSIPTYVSDYGFATVEFGINDLSPSSYNKTPEKFRDDLIVLLNDFNSKGWTDDKIVVLSIPGSWFPAYPTSTFRATINAANSLTKALCASRKILWVDVTNPFFSGTAPYGWDLTTGQSVYADDTVHPNDVGYALMASVVYGAIQGVPFQPIFNARLENVSIANSGVAAIPGSLMLSQNKFGSTTWSNSLTYGSGELKNKQAGAVFTMVDNGLTNPSANAFRIFGNAQNQYGLGVSSESTFVPQIVMDGATGGIGIGGAATNTSVGLDIQGTTKAFKMGTATRAAIATPVNGMLTTDNNVPYFYDGTSWDRILEATSPTITTPIIVGVTNGSSASAGNVGQMVRSIQSTYTNFTTTATYQQIATISLTPGDWYIYAEATVSGNNATMTGNTIFTLATVTASATGAVEGESIAYVSALALTGTNNRITTHLSREVSISSTTSYFLNGQSTFSVGNPQFVGSIKARRLR